MTSFRLILQFDIRLMSNQYQSRGLFIPVPNQNPALSHTWKEQFVFVFDKAQLLCLLSLISSIMDSFSYIRWNVLPQQMNYGTHTDVKDDTIAGRTSNRHGSGMKVSDRYLFLNVLRVSAIWDTSHSKSVITNICMKNKFHIIIQKSNICTSVPVTYVYHYWIA